MSPVKIAAIATFSFLLGLALFSFLMNATWVAASVAHDWQKGASHNTRVWLAAMTLIIWFGATAAVMFGVVRLGARALSVDFRWALFVVAVLAGASLYWAIPWASEMNDCAWDVGFPVGGECWAR